jgi:signal peptidase I
MARDAVEILLLVAVIFFGIKFSIETRPVDGTSMQPGLHTGQYLFENRLAYAFGSPQRGDVIVFKYPFDDSSYFVKRIIGLPGDTITIGPTTVAINGVQLQEPYISAPDNCSVLGGQACTKRTIILGKDQFWVMGDNRPASCDSRVWGELDRKEIVGKVSFVFWPSADFHAVNMFHDAFAHVPAPANPVPATGTGVMSSGRC